MTEIINNSKDKNVSHGFNWKGGRYIDGNGYVKIWKPDHIFVDSKGYVKEHRLVYEEHFKCCLLPWAVIHHINKNKQDNRIENLMPFFSHSLHISYELLKDLSDRSCSICNSKNTAISKRNGRPKWHNYNDNFICTRCFDKLRYYKDLEKNREKAKLRMRIKRSLLS